MGIVPVFLFLAVLSAFLISSDLLYTIVVVLATIIAGILLDDVLGMLVALTLLIGALGYRIMNKIDDLQKEQERKQGDGKQITNTINDNREKEGNNEKKVQIPKN